jgi:hypothetical protein
MTTLRSSRLCPGVSLLTVALLAAVSSASAEVGDVVNQQKVSDDAGGFDGQLDPGDFFGFSVDALGDFNGDGVPDVVVGAPGDDGVVGADEGSFWVLFLKSNGRVHRYRKFSPGVGPVAVPGSQLAYDIANVGDLDGDGTVDLAAGAPFFSTDTLDERGIVWIFFMDDDGTVEDVERFDGFGSDFSGRLRAGDRFGSAVAGIGDLDGDGVPDLAVGAPGDDDGGLNRGAVWILFMTKDGLVDGYEKISDTEGAFAGKLENGDGFGSSVASIGDVDGDGVNDLAVGAPFDDDGDGDGIDVGAVWILFMNANGRVKGERLISKKDDVIGSKLEQRDYFGWDVAGVGDLDGDGISDLAVAAPGDDDGSGQDRGAFYLLFLDSDGLPKREHKVSDTVGGFNGNLDPANRFGSSVAALGDLDGDGVTELAVGAPGDDDGAGLDSGATWILFLEGPPSPCGDADGDGDIRSTDALVALYAAVGTESCELCVCDVNDSGAVTAVDAQALLAASVALPVELVCPACG